MNGGIESELERSDIKDRLSLLVQRDDLVFEFVQVGTLQVVLGILLLELIKHLLNLLALVLVQLLLHATQGLNIKRWDETRVSFFYFT